MQRKVRERLDRLDDQRVPFPLAVDGGRHPGGFYFVARWRDTS